LRRSRIERGDNGEVLSGAEALDRTQEKFVTDASKKDEFRPELSKDIHKVNVPEIGLSIRSETFLSRLEYSNNPLDLVLESITCLAGTCSRIL